ncbi:TetR family transcriptional regulator [Phytohabitans sp. ZYX-F-186]|uniref:TetR family transcriptional regulator n=1 Tax=Phytohabitans maris TaxID=3071409 RepID=A0ABU0ZIW8_9ACTN|nr:TetR family transcriptional regulator [Phytohabitans sp. ZYX-F-186]MDQ7906991.1 TetR family transcriptional regulator [Phytohabitans sp. ZYX-F-186]
MSPSTTVDGTSLRERKKQRTREALIDAAFELFTTKGFEATTVDEIAEAVEVSSRTFFRYFGSKEDVATSVQLQQFLDVYSALDARPAGEPVVTALRHAVGQVLRAYEEGGDDAFQFACVMRLVQDSPAVMARSLEMCTEQLDEMALRVAGRMGVDPIADPRPKLVAAVASAALQVAVRAWRETEPDEKVSDLADRAFALLEAGINYPPPA